MVKTDKYYFVKRNKCVWAITKGLYRNTLDAHFSVTYKTVRCRVVYLLNNNGQLCFWHVISRIR